MSDRATLEARRAGRAGEPLGMGSLKLSLAFCFPFLFLFVCLVFLLAHLRACFFLFGGGGVCGFGFLYWRPLVSVAGSGSDSDRPLLLAVGQHPGTPTTQIPS